MRKRRATATSGGELKLRALLLQVFPGERVLYNHRPDWLRGCELDVFFPRLKLGLEYNGRQHREFTPHFHRTAKVFSQQVGRDLFKAERCQSRGVRLVTVEYPHVASTEALRERIASELAGTAKDADASPPPKRGRVLFSSLKRPAPRDLFSQ